MQKYFEIPCYSEGEILTLYAWFVHSSSILALTANGIRIYKWPGSDAMLFPVSVYRRVIPIYSEKAMRFVPGQHQLSRNKLFQKTSN